MFDSSRYIIPLLLFISVASCAGPNPRPLVSTIPEETPRETPIRWDQYEDFDPAPYREDLEDRSTMILHDVPEVLLFSDPSSTQSRFSSGELSGYRIQIISTLNKQEADQAVEDALAWWRDFEQVPDLIELYPRKEEGPPVYQDFRVPYYRVRIGNFTTREEAELILEVIERDYARAFIAPDLVILQ